MATWYFCKNGNHWSEQEFHCSKCEEFLGLGPESCESETDPGVVEESKADLFVPDEGLIKKIQENPRSGVGAGGSVEGQSNLLILVPIQEPAVSRREQNGSIKSFLAELNKQSPPMCEEIVKREIEKTKLLSEVDIKSMPISDCIGVLARLTCTLQAVPAMSEDHKECLQKLYQSMKLDPEFAEDDRKRRAKVLDMLTSEESGIGQMREACDSGAIKVFDQKNRDLFNNIGQTQASILQEGFVPEPLIFKELGKNAGECKGNQAYISTTSQNRSFDEVLDTVIHETTHAYQNYLIKELDRSITPDDPRYAQAMLFKLNQRTFIYPSDDRTSETIAQDLAYRKQPLEKHAWKAGGEAGRVFDVKSAPLRIAMVRSNLQDYDGEERQRINTLLDKAEKELQAKQPRTGVIAIHLSSCETLAIDDTQKSLFAMFDKIYGDLEAKSDKEVILGLEASCSDFLFKPSVGGLQEALKCWNSMKPWWKGALSFKEIQTSCSAASDKIKDVISDYEKREKKTESGLSACTEIRSSRKSLAEVWLKLEEEERPVWEKVDDARGILEQLEQLSVKAQKTLGSLETTNTK